MKKQDIEFHSEHMRGGHPAVNVKVYTNSHYQDKVVDKFKCTEEVAERAVSWAWDSAVRRFWEDAEEMVKELFPSSTMYSEGRSGGWLTVHRLPDVESWDAIMVGKWSKLVHWCEVEIAYLSSVDCVLEDIEANRWAEEDAEEYNFIDKDGQTKCLADEPRCAHCKGKAT